MQQCCWPSSFTLLLSSSAHRGRGVGSCLHKQEKESRIKTSTTPRPLHTVGGKRHRGSGERGSVFDYLIWVKENVKNRSSGFIQVCSTHLALLKNWYVWMVFWCVLCWTPWRPKPRHVGLPDPASSHTKESDRKDFLSSSFRQQKPLENDEKCSSLFSKAQWSSFRCQVLCSQQSETLTYSIWNWD